MGLLHVSRAISDPVPPGTGKWGPGVYPRCVSCCPVPPDTGKWLPGVYPQLRELLSPLAVRRVKWEHEIVRLECSADREPCECHLVASSRRAYRTVIVIGIIIVVTGVIGLCGSCCESHTTLFLVRSDWWA